MPWPLASDFSAIVQHPQLAFRDPRLQGCRIERNALRQPRVWSGAFAVVYKGVDSEGKAWAIRGFTSESGERRTHYEQISAHLKRRKPSCLVDFEYRDAGIRSASDGKWYPLVVMDWVQGVTLWSWVQAKCRKRKGPSLAKGARHWLRLIQELRAAEVVHGDLQHANVLVTPAGRLKLVDYDGMGVPALVGRRNLEIGVRPYQHPQRDESTLLSANLDHFSALVIYVALRALAADTSLWERHVEQAAYDKLLFRTEDFANREQSALYRDLMNSPDPAVRTLAAQLFACARDSLDNTPGLNELVEGNTGAIRAAQESVAGLPWQPPVAAAPSGDHLAARIVLTVVAGPLKGRTFSVERHRNLLVGRGKDCHVRIGGDRRISRHHFLLELVPPRARLRDLDSGNGTYVNGVKYGGRSAGEAGMPSEAARPAGVDLKHGDQITAGRTVLLLHVEGGTPALEDAEPVPETPGRCGDQPAEPAEPAARLVDHLAVREAIGKGPLGTVYEAKCRRTERLLALKIVPPRIEIGAVARQRVQAELERFQQLRHPHVVPLLEVGTLGGAFYLVQEYCVGGSLDAWLKEQGGKLILAHARPLMFQCLDALDYAHRQQLLHGDLKPRNVLLQIEDGKRVARIGDFGLARTLEQAGCSGMTTTAMDHPFLPRERVLESGSAQPHSDLWSLAAVFYHLLTGQYPRDTTGSEPLSGILDSETVPIRERNSQVPKPVAQVIDRALASNPKKRFPDAVRMKAHLRRAFERVRADRL